MKPLKINHKIGLAVGLIPPILAAILALIYHMASATIPAPSLGMAWFLTTGNFVFAVICNMLAVQKDFQSCLVVMAVGGLARNGLLLVAAMVVHSMRPAEFSIPFILSMFGLYAVYLAAEVMVTFKFGKHIQ